MNSIPNAAVSWYKTYFSLAREGCNKTRLLCFVRTSIEVKERKDLMSDQIPSIWLEFISGKQKILICTVYRELSNLVTPGQMGDIEQREKWEIFMNQAKKASQEGITLVIGDTNLDLERFEDATYYQKSLSEQY